MVLFPHSIEGFVLCKLSLGRISEYLCLPELQQYKVLGDISAQVEWKQCYFGYISMHSMLLVFSTLFMSFSSRDCTNFRWHSNDNIALSNVHLTIEKGSLVAVVGEVGSGKSKGETRVQLHSYLCVFVCHNACTGRLYE